MKRFPLTPTAPKLHWYASFAIDAAVWISSIAFIFYQLRPLLHGVEPAGWDTQGHLYVYKEFLGNLARGKLRGYDFLWGGGYPTFYLYPPLGYLLLALPCLAFRSAVSPLQSFDIGIFFVACLTLVTFFYLGWAYFGRRGGRYALIFGMIMLATPPEYDYLGVGLAGALSTGLLTNFLVLPFFILFILFLERWRATQRILFGVGVALCVAIIFSIHTLTFLFTAWTWLWYVIFAERGHRRALVIMLAGGFALAAPSIYEMWRHLPYASGSPVGLWGESPDPLFPLFSGLTPQRIYVSFIRAWESVPALPTAASGGLAPVATPFKIPFIAAYFPYAGILVLATLVAGITAQLRERRWFLPVIYLVTLIVLPRNFLTQDASMPIHFYRFIQPLAILQIILCARGACALFEFAAKRGVFNRVLACALPILIVCAIVVNNFLDFSLTQKSWLRDSEVRPYRSYFTIDSAKYPDRQFAEELMNYLFALRPDGRVAVESAEIDLRLLGSVHFFSAQLPMRFNIPIVPGLLAESMLSSSFVNPALIQHSEHLHWGKIDLASDIDFDTQPLSAQLERLELFGVEYIISSSTTYFNSLLEESLKGGLTFVKAFGSFGLFRLRAPRPLAEQLAYKPFLYVGGSAAQFREFAQTWYLNPKLFAMPVIYAPRHYEKLTDHERDSIGGFILEHRGSDPLDSRAIESITKVGKPVLVLNFNAGPAVIQGAPVNFVPDFKGIAGSERLFQSLRSFAEPPVFAQPLGAAFTADGTISVETTGTALIRASYGPNWVTQQAHQTVFWATPCHILVFGAGSTQLRYSEW